MLINCEVKIQVGLRESQEGGARTRTNEGEGER